ncbi:MAG: two-component sensor histidine kinase [Alphaproteobacteria bacterium]|nr:two-component sensor histidine kinase [Alphaproteobacteria bacterium]
MISIRRYLLKYLISVLTLGSLVIAYFIFFHARDEINELYDNNMVDIAATLESQMSVMPFAGKGLLGPSQRVKLNREEEFLVEVWSKEGESIYRSHEHIHFPLQSGRGQFITQYDGKDWRVYSLDVPQGVIQVSQPQHARDIFTRQMALQLLIPMIAQIPLIGLFIWLTVGRSLQPLSKISSAIHARSASSMEPIDSEDIPVEVLPMVQALNALLERLEAALQAQQRFTADAAHELRTPLTALQLQLNLLARSKSAESRETAIGKLQTGIDRATHLVQQLLTLARLEPEAITRAHKVVSLTEIAKTVVEQQAQQAAVKNIDFGLNASGTSKITGDAESLRILIGNLVDNAIRYTPEGGKVDVELYSAEGKVTLNVTDTGIGIPETERGRIFERFYRVNAQQGDGTGLGLSIVSHIAKQHDATVEIISNLKGGTTFRIAFK